MCFFNSMLLAVIFAIGQSPVNAQHLANDSTTYYIKVEPDGIARMRYPTGEVYAQGSITHRGKWQRQEGEWVYFRRGGEVDRVMSYVDGELDGIAYFYEGVRIFRIDYYEKNKLVKRALVPADVSVSP